MNAPALIDRYFDLAPRPDVDAYFAQFAPDADVEDGRIESLAIRT